MTDRIRYRTGFGIKARSTLGLIVLVLLLAALLAAIFAGALAGLSLALHAGKG